MATPVAALLSAALLGATPLASHVQLPSAVAPIVTAASHVAAAPGIAALLYAASVLPRPDAEPSCPSPTPVVVGESATGRFE